MSGPWRDMAVRRRPTEVDHMLGWVVAEARSRGFANLDELEDFRRSIHGETIGAPA